MSDVSKRRLRLHVLASATAIAISSMCAMPAMAAGRIDLSGLQSPEQKNFDRFIVKYRDGSTERASTASLDSALRSATRAIPAKAGRALEVRQLRRLAVGADVVRSDRKLDRVEAESLMRQLASNPNVEYVEVDKLNKPLLTPNDPRFSEQWGYGTGAGGIRATEAWDTTNGAGSVVAILDTGITTHSDLNANILPGYDFIIDTAVSVDGDGRDSNPADPGDGYNANECGAGIPASNSSWHGTHVAGTVAAVTNNGVGVAGVAYGAKIVPVRVLGKCGGYDSDIADAIIWASGGTVSGVPANANPAEVINLSLGGSGACGATTQTAINGAVGRGTTLVIAAGNDNTNVSNASPANCNNVVAVGSITSTGARSSFSNYGALVDVAAPGSSILSTLNAGARTPGAETYASYSGTSMATPHVAGVVALIQAVSATPKTPAQVEALLKSSARAFPSTPSQPIGAGIVNAKAAVDAAGGGGGNVAPVANFTSSASGLTVSFTDTSTDSDGSIASRSWNFGDGTTSTATNPSKTYSAAGTYTVTLTVTDNGGATNTKTSSVTVSSGGGGTVLSNGVPVTGLSAATGASLNYTMVVPAGASNLTFTTSGGTGDMDMYVKSGSAPTDTVYDCRPYVNGNAETCTFAAPTAGTYYVRLKAYSAFSGVSLTGSYTTGGGGGTQTYTNGTDVAIGDNTTVNSPITVSGRSGSGLASTSVAVNIVHTYIGDLKVDLVAPDGSVYVLHNRSGGSADNINSTYTVNLSSEALNGTWNLRVNDNAGGDTGYINSWSVTF
ncbi:S8 family serine peptidase [Pseudoxanthomonas sacheonensis]|uniref:Serine protease n=1 Tax=Pseudoxanthomonas sacheonensis TaxID=443615 RepID=A0ABU1RW05_9GAMM|nr:serine protease [Pseudoxanthomonas sacheonensis]